MSSGLSGVITGAGGGGGSCVIVPSVNAPSVFVGTTSPSTPIVGTVQWNSNSHELLIFDGTTWQTIATQPHLPHLQKLLDKYPTLKQAWDHYQIVLRMCEAQERLEE